MKTQLKVGDIVFDDLTKRKAEILEVLDDRGTPAYMLDNHCCGGFRYEWEVTMLIDLSPEALEAINGLLEDKEDIGDEEN